MSSIPARRVSSPSHAALLAVALGCSSGSSPASGNSGPTSDGGAGGAMAGGAGAGGDAAGASAGGNSSTIAGSVSGSAFDGAAASLWIGAPDSPGTIVVYLFSKPTMCSEIGAPGWDSRIADGTLVLEMKTFGITPATYTVVKSPNPAAGDASVNFTVSSTASTPSETSAGGGTVTVSSVEPAVTARGSFSLEFGADRLNGSFDATYCPAGVEP